MSLSKFSAHSNQLLNKNLNIFYLLLSIAILLFLFLFASSTVLPVIEKLQLHYLTYASAERAADLNIAVTGVSSSASSPSLQQEERVIDIQKAKQFVKSQYDANVKLVKEAPTLNRFWLWPDNVLAVKVLSGFDNLLAQTISQTVNQYKSQHNLVMRHPIDNLVDMPGDFSVKSGGVLQISTNPDVRYADYAVGNTELTCNQYGDIAFLNSIHLFEQGKTDEAKTCYEEGAAQFDGIGIDDAPRQLSYGGYDIYKMLLWKIAQNITGFTTDAPPQPYTDNLIKRAQDSSGGIKSEYTSIDSISGLTNVQTTSLAILAYDKAQPTLSTVGES